MATAPGGTSASASPDVVAADREAAVDRARALFVAGVLPYRVFSRVLDDAFAARDRAGLAGAMSALPSPVRLTPPTRRLGGPLLVRAAEGGTAFGPGWQLAAETTVATGTGPVELDLAAASWDAEDVHLHLETWGTVAILVPAGVAVQVTMASVPVLLEPLVLSAPGAPVLQISARGPTGVIRVSNPAPSAHHRRPGRKREGDSGDRGTTP